MTTTGLLFAALLLLLPVFVNEVNVVCDHCPPGTHLRVNCTDICHTECRPCSTGFYTDFWNYIPECLPCDLCALNQEETQPCTPSQNRVCQCKEGYRLSDFCKKHTVCPAGHGIKNKETSYKDTECSGHGVDGAGGSTQCTPQTALHVDDWHDNVCVTCNSITTEG
ncbi:tumor necrosis factor receptor superfamily member 11B-like [Colossoma macropomum]|uniref:tumor necrosis factor receptor superfamily member 11B-like n=1 Tax=Colossoma macropomum TaxID=42526 RepID=UPI001864338F|nr:tumor necrosis factor receptor superfamily member 11B-like [Colossoma macropomum]